MEYAIGIMSGTSLDGIDVALVGIQNYKYELIDFESYPLDYEMKNKIGLALTKETSNVELICSLNFELGQYFGKAVQQLCNKNNIVSSTLSFVASHGQTIYHHPKETESTIPSTLQIGESSVISELTQTTVVSDFRYRDMAVSGQGAPIVPFSEYLLYKSSEKNRVLQNIGGIGNATLIPKDGTLDDVIAFDTGPGNMIIDELCRHFYNQEFDKDGTFGSQGSVHEPLLNHLMSHPFIKKSAPKTTGREEFGKQYVDSLLKLFSDVTPNDFIRTATLFTAQSIAKAIEPYITSDTEMIVGGGGSYNPVLLSFLKQELPTVHVCIQEDIGFSSEAKEAIAMVVLGHHTLNRLPSNVPSATGAKKSVILGKITYYN